MKICKGQNVPVLNIHEAGSLRNAEGIIAEILQAADEGRYAPDPQLLDRLRTTRETLELVESASRFALEVCVAEGKGHSHGR